MPWKIIVPLVLVIAVVAVVVLATGESKADKAMSQVCDSRADIKKQLDTLQGLQPGSALDQARTSLKAIGDDLKSIADARGDLADDKRDQVQSANQQFVATVKSAAGSVTDLTSLGSAGDTVRQAGQQLAQSYRTTFAKLDCS